MSCSARLPVYLLLIGAFLSDFAWWVPGLTLFGMYALGLVVAPLMALLLKRTLLRGETPVFVMELPLYKVPSLRLVLRRSVDAGMMFVRRAGTLILATMVLVWSLLYSTPTGRDGRSYDKEIVELETSIAPARAELNKLAQELKDERPTGSLPKYFQGSKDSTRLRKKWNRWRCRRRA